jgi:5-methylcytosine-specific restriction protein B
MSDATFDWVPFYKELVQKIRTLGTDRETFLKKVKEVVEFNTKLGYKTPTPLNFVDPFSVFGIFNRDIAYENRKKLVTKVKDVFDIDAVAPENFNGIPVAQCQDFNYLFFDLDEQDKPSANTDADTLWDLYESALKYADNPTDAGPEKVGIYFDKALKIKKIGTPKLTVGLFWIAPEVFLNLDGRNVWYIYESTELPSDFVSLLPPKPKHNTSFKTYLRIKEEVRNFLKSNSLGIHNFLDLSYKAWIRSEEANKQIKEEKKLVEEKAKKATSSTSDTNSKQENQEQKAGSESPDAGENSDSQQPTDKAFPPYSKDDFLSDVYLSEEDYESLRHVLFAKQNVILQGAPGVGKTYAARRLAWSVMGEKDPNRIAMLQFHQSYSYEDFIMGFRPTESGFELRKGAFYSFCKKAEKDPNKKYFLIIDEINRGNLSKIFGELFMLIEKDKRGIELQLLYSDEKFSVPDNLYIIGTMNTADRSLAMLDYALRRRFAFFDIKPAFGFDGFKKQLNEALGEKAGKVIEAVEKVNEEIRKDPELGEGFCIGHSFFMGWPKDKEEARLKSVIKYELIPLLREYFFDKPNAFEKRCGVLLAVIEK